MTLGPAKIQPRGATAAADALSKHVVPRALTRWQEQLKQLDRRAQQRGDTPDHEHRHTQSRQASTALRCQASHQEEPERQADRDVDEDIEAPDPRPACEADLLHPTAGGQGWRPEVERDQAAVHDECSDRRIDLPVSAQT